MKRINKDHKATKIILFIFIMVFGFFLLAWSADHQRFGLVSVSPNLELKGNGKNIDSIAFWEAPDPSKSLMFVTAKINSLVEVWQYPFVNSELTPLIHSTFDSSKVNGVVVDQEADLLYVSVADPSSTTSVFNLPQLEFVKQIRKKGANLKSEPNLALLKLHDGTKRIYISADDIVYIHDATTGKYLREFTPLKGLETMVGDSFYQVLYIPDENDRSGIYAYQPDGSIYKRYGKNRFGESVFEKDGEGIIVYAHHINGKDTGKGLIVVADQRKPMTDFEVFDRESWFYHGTVRIRGVSNTDGIASTQQPLPGYPLGLFAAVNNDRSVVCVGWDDIFEATGLKFE